MLKKSGVFLLAMILVAGAVISGCSYSKVLRNRLPTPHRVDDFEFAVKFVYEAPQARNVNLCGNWDENGWCGTQTSGRFDHSIASMQDDDKDGIWEVIVPLKPGRYLYKFSVDWGMRWENDQNNPLGEDDSFGGVNSILILH
jgi:1,4-alpha-glucan branching enzyme